MAEKHLPQLLDCAQIARELGVKRGVAEAYMRQLPKVTVPGNRKVFVKRDDLAKLIDDNTHDVVARRPLRHVA